MTMGTQFCVAPPNAIKAFLKQFYREKNLFIYFDLAVSPSYKHLNT